MREHDKYHEPQILFHNNWGYIVRCRDCRLFQVAFGNIALDIDFNEFVRLAKFLKAEFNHYQRRKCRKRKDIYINTPSRSVRFLFTIEELKFFNDMLQRTHLLVQPEESQN